MREYDFQDGRRLTVATIYGIGKNYAKHAKEMGGEVPADPIIFIKPPAAYIPNEGIIQLPPISNNVHHEVELVVVIGKDCQNISRSEARSVIAGYGVGIDVTMRDIQNSAKSKGEPWAVSKGFHTSAPISMIIPAEKFDNEIPFFALELYINGELRQKGNTADMERPVDLLIEYLSNIFTLRQGDCIFTGTPEGVGKISAGDKINAELKGYATLNVAAEAK
ncbi:MAG: hypothetical protein QG635_746 [Bacteroidota bacterium]|nr:hypothetical protein [Bacteroidota bacterium]